MRQCFATFVFIIACSSPFWHATAQQDSRTGQCPPENPPQILVASAIDSDDQLILVSYHSIFIGFGGESYNERLTTKVSLKDCQICTADGEKVTLESARKRISGKDTPIVVTPYKTDLPKFYAALFAPETLVFVFPSKTPQWKQIESPGAVVRK